MRILFDNGIFSHSEFAEGAIKKQEVLLGDIRQTVEIQGFTRKPPHREKEYQDQIDALFTIGRLIKEEKVIAYDYIEIQFERMRDTGKNQVFNALQGCEIQRCRSPLERSKFRQSINLIDTISKGGKKDRKAGIDLGETNQIAFYKWLITLGKEHVDVLIQHATEIGLTEFEVENLKNIDWFQFVCQRSGSPENYPDVFHLWTAERNGFDGFLTLEKSLPNLISRINNEKTREITTNIEVLRPLDLINKLGIGNPDPVPMEKDRFYHLHEVE